MAYHVLRTGSLDSEGPEEEIFIQRKEDGAYHLLGFRPIAVKYLFSERECTQDDLGKISLPQGKSRLEHLVAGDRLSVADEKGNVSEYKFYLFS